MMSNKTNIDQKYIPIVLCAGFGTRLRPLTDYLPKVVCPVGNTPIAFFAIEFFFQAGFQEVYCNTHYLAEVVQKELQLAAMAKGYDPARIVFFQEDNILETGGGIARIYQELCQKKIENKKKDLIVLSGDILSEIPLNEMITRWEKRNSKEKALMCTVPMQEQRPDITWVQNGHVVGFGKEIPSQKQGEKSLLSTSLGSLSSPLQKRIFSNHQILCGEVVFQTPIEKVSSILLFYGKILNEGGQILHVPYPHHSHYWFNVGTLKEYLDCLSFFQKKEKETEEEIFCLNLYHYPEKLYVALKEAIQQKGYSILHKEKNHVVFSLYKKDFIPNKKNACFHQLVSLNQLCLNEESVSSPFYFAFDGLDKGI